MPEAFIAGEHGLYDNLKEKYYHYTSIIDMINEKYEAHVISPYGEIPYTNLNNISKKNSSISILIQVK
mgnify:CR=1 FL=1